MREVKARRQKPIAMHAAEAHAGAGVHMRLLQKQDTDARARRGTGCTRGRLGGGVGVAGLGPLSACKGPSWCVPDGARCCNCNCLVQPSRHSNQNLAPPRPAHTFQLPRPAAYLRGGHHVDRDLVAAECVEHGGQEAVLAHHARADDVHQRHVALEHDGRHHAARHVAVRRDDGAGGLPGVGAQRGRAGARGRVGVARLKTEGTGAGRANGASAMCANGGGPS